MLPVLFPSLLNPISTTLIVYAFILLFHSFLASLDLITTTLTTGLTTVIHIFRSGLKLIYALLVDVPQVILGEILDVVRAIFLECAFYALGQLHGGWSTMNVSDNSDKGSKGSTKPLVPTNEPVVQQPLQPNLPSSPSTPTRIRNSTKIPPRTPNPISLSFPFPQRLFSTLIKFSIPSSPIRSKSKSRSKCTRKIRCRRKTGLSSFDAAVKTMADSTAVELPSTVIICFDATARGDVENSLKGRDEMGSQSRSGHFSLSGVDGGPAELEARGRLKKRGREERYKDVVAKLKRFQEILDGY